MFRSDAQRKYLFANDPELAKEFASKTPKGKKLPEHVKKNKKKSQYGGFGPDDTLPNEFDFQSDPANLSAFMQFMQDPKNQQLLDQYKKAGYSATEANQGNGIQFSRGTGIRDFSKPWKAANTLIDFTTGAANFVGNINNNRQEYKDWMQFAQPRITDNKDANGLLQPSYLFQNGGRNPIYTDNKNDPRLRAYNDSLNAYKWNDISLDKLQKSGLTPMGKSVNLAEKRKMSYKQALNEIVIKDNNLGINIPLESEKNYLNTGSPLNKGTGKIIHPESFYNFPIVGGGNYNLAQYKKPVQPVIYKAEANLPLVNKSQYETRGRANIQSPIAEIDFQPQALKSNSSGDPIYGPSNGLIGYGNNNQFIPANGALGTTNQADMNLLNNPSALKQYIQSKGYKFQMGGQTNSNILAEAGEVIQSPQKDIFKISDQADDHDDSSGGVIIPNAERVLEDTGDKRKDKMSKFLLISPEELQQMTGVRSKKSVTHAKAFELAAAKSKKDFKFTENKLKKNTDSLDNNPNDIYAKNSLNLNLLKMDSIPTEGEHFDTIFDHQESVKQLLSIADQKKAQFGDNMKKFQTGGTNEDPWTKKLKYLNEQRNRQAIGSPVDNPSIDYDKLYQQTQMQASRNALGTYQQSLTNNPNAGIFPYRGDRTNKSNASKYSRDQWQNFANDLGFTGNNNQDFQNFLFNMNGDQGTPDLQSGIIDLHQKYGNPNTPPATNSMQNWLDGRLGHRWDAVMDNYYQNNNPTEPLTSVNGTESDYAPVNSSQPQQKPLVFNPNQPTQNNLNLIPQPDSGFKVPLKWYDVAAPVSAYVDALRRENVRFNPLELTAPQAKYLDPTPALNQVQGDFNTTSSTLPSNGIGYSNQANLMSKKYELDNQILGNYNNQNNGIWNQNEMARVNTKNAQSQSDQQAREAFETKRLQGISAQKRQLFESLKNITDVIGSNQKYQREGALLMKLFPHFDQKGSYNGNKFQFTNPTSSPLQTKLDEMMTELQKKAKKKK